MHSQTAGLEPVSEGGWQEDRSGLKEREAARRRNEKKDEEETKSVKKKNVEEHQDEGLSLWSVKKQEIQ